MGSLITSPLQEAQKWRERSLHPRPRDECAARSPKSAKAFSRRDGCGPFAFSEAKKYASRAFPKAHSKTPQQWMAKVQFEDSIVQALVATPAKAKDIAAEFNKQAEKWESETAYLSSTPKKILHESYQSIMAMGPDVVPYLLRDLQKTGRSWFWALRHLTHTNPVVPEDQGNLDKMISAWLSWGKREGLI